MPSPPKIFINNTVVMITTRTEEGLPFVPTPFMNEIIWSALATAQGKYWVDLIWHTVQANHLHMIIRVVDPEAVPLFVGYVKQEIAHRLNRLLGRRKRTIWAEGYDSPILLDIDKVLEEIAYVALNQVKDHIVEKIEHYPGVSAAAMFNTEQFAREYVYLPRDDVPALRNPHEPWREISAVMGQFTAIGEAKNARKVQLVLSPYAWKKCFAETRNLSDAEIRTMIVERLKRLMDEISAERVKLKRTKFSTAHELIRQSMLRPYMPKSFGKRMICLASNVDLRRAFIDFIGAIRVKAKEIWAEFRAGNYSQAFPAGLYPPGRGTMASILNWAPV